jgi:4-hydroxybenzoate polyprenyltransferase
MYNFIRLVRPINIVVIFLTMYSLRFFYTNLQIKLPNTTIFERIDFFLLVFSTLLIAAGGNVINDYFDVKADKINKPEKLIISKYINQRFAILSHWFLNGFALLIGTYLSIKHNSFSIIFLFLICINILWFYSIYFKRKILIGNFFVAFLTALVPLTCGLYFKLTGLATNLSNLENESWFSILSQNYNLIIGMALFAFLLNFAREIVKDIQDVRGDKVLKAKTLPIIIGDKNSKWIAAIILSVIPFLSVLIYMPFINVQNIKSDCTFFLPFLIVLIIVLISILLLLFSNKIKLIDRLLKLAMFLGLILPFYWILI